jgi:hypothetical protein
MGLVGYSDSDASSDDDSKPTSKQTSKPITQTKASFQKFTDSSNPNKIRVNLPETSNSSALESSKDGEPSAKKPKTSGGFGGFNAMLPTPKRAKTTIQGSRGKGLVSGISLKTGATPGFSREPQIYASTDTEEALDEEEKDSEHLDTESGKPDDEEVSKKEIQAPPKKTGNAMMFKPLSVSRKPQKKKVVLPPPSSDVVSTHTATKPKPKVSLFSTPVIEEASSTVSTGAYKPMIYNATTHEEGQGDAENLDIQSEMTSQPSAIPSTSSTSHSGPQSLASVADSLNLSAAARRQLFGRKTNTMADVNVVEFNTDAEYQANEELRANGEQIQHNPVRSIAAGKHSLTQLVNAVANQREALEESFATARRNKREAGSKYGW